MSMKARTACSTARVTRDRPATGSAAQSKRDRGLLAYLAGSAAEEQVMLDYLSRGAVCLEQRWRGQSGEIDLIFRDQGVVVFVEVKTSRTHDRAIASLRPAQVTRIYNAASEYLAHVPEGQLADIRFDLATMDALGGIGIMENAFGQM
ncbi:YraN family protein [Roseovarius sp. E0-M6]|uniref:YraN family protein n=1 Tax=Roseovarius sp. E0-M6 TaxID=3127118 RepID=UPI00300FC55C